MLNVANAETLIRFLIDNKEHHDQANWATRVGSGALENDGPAIDAAGHWCGNGTVCAAGAAILLAGYYPLFNDAMDSTYSCAKPPFKRAEDICIVAARWLGIRIGDLAGHAAENVFNGELTHDETISCLKELVNAASTH
jgi:hypothetical protein